MSDFASIVNQLVTSVASSTTRAAAVVIDDISMTPQVSDGFPEAREGQIFRRVFWGSLRTKVVVLTPIGLLLNRLAPQSITPLLGLGGMYLAYEGASGLLEKLGQGEAERPASKDEVKGMSEDEREDERVRSVVRTDFVLSAEIMAVSLSALPKEGLALQAASLVMTAVFITLLVYGSGYLIVRSDNFGARLSASESSSFIRRLGRFIRAFMPVFLRVLSWLGSFAMLWVAGQLMFEALEFFELSNLQERIDQLAQSVQMAAPFWGGFFGGLAGAICDGILGLTIGLILVFITRKILRPLFGKRGESAS